MVNVKPIMQIILAIAGLAFAYYLAAKLSLPLTAPPSGASAFWPAAGIALAFVLKFGPKLLLGVFLGSLANIADKKALPAQRCKADPKARPMEHDK